ncbi:MAG: DUF4293 domain-containing protein [Flavobacteriales bacterium]|jgi:hypothetical protein
MIQRVQTLWMLGAMLSQIILAFLPFAAGQDWSYSAWSLLNGGTGLPGAATLLTAYGMGLIMPFMAIFLYKKRKVQARVLVYGLVSQGLFGIFAWTRALGMEGLELSRCAGLFWPIISIVCLSLAIRGVMKDEALVRSMDRIR